MFFNNADIKLDKIDDNSSRKVLAHSDNLMNARVFFKQATPNEKVKTHNHVHEQLTYVLKDSFKFEIHENGQVKAQVVHVGDSIYFPSNVYHGCIPLEDGSELLDSFTPARQDFLK